ncbi:hypothetical protein CH370_13360 [Leptospira kmetyi]|nr:hypothetical protein CH370_13360 [Leptospira kmetyi]
MNPWSVMSFKFENLSKNLGAPIHLNQNETNSKKKFNVQVPFSLAKNPQMSAHVTYGNYCHFEFVFEMNFKIETKEDKKESHFRI